MAGPYTQQAIGDRTPEVDPIEQGVADANAQGNPNNIGVIPKQDTRSTPVDPTAPPQSAFSLQVRGPQYGRQITNQDLVPHPDPRVITHAGNSFSMPAFQAGMAAVDSRLQEMERQRQDLIKSAQQLTADDNREKVAPQYARSYNAFVDKTQQDFLNSMIARYGSENKAWEKIAKDPTIRRQWEQLHRDNNEVGRAINYDVGDAEKYLTGVGAGQYRYNPQAVQASQNLIQGYGQLGAQGLGDLSQLMNITNEYKKHTTPEYTFNKAGIDDRVAKFAEQRYQNLRHDKEGKLLFTSWEEKKDFDTQISQLANEWYPAFADQYTKEEFTQWLHDRYPSQVELHMQSRAIPQPKGGSGANEGKVWTTEPTVRESIGGNMSETVKQDGYTRRTPKVESIGVGRIVGGRQEPFGTVTFYKHGAPVKMNWTSIDKGADGEPVLVGYDPDDTSVHSDVDNIKAMVEDQNAILRKDHTEELISKAFQNGITDVKKAQEWASKENERIQGEAKKERDRLMSEAQKVQKDVRKITIPLKGNEGLADGYMAGGLNATVSKFSSGGQKGPTQEEFDKMPSGTTFVGPDGKTYKKP